MASFDSMAYFFRDDISLMLEEVYISFQIFQACNYFFMITSTLIHKVNFSGDLESIIKILEMEATSFRIKIHKRSRRQHLRNNIALLGCIPSPNGF